MDITIKIAILAVAAQVFLTIFAFFRMGKARTAALVRGDLHIRDIALSGDAWADDIKKLGKNLQNQFETPVLLYVAVGFMAALSIHSWLIALASIVFVGLRIMHHLVHTGKNHVPTRFKLFVSGLLVLAIIWIAIVIEVVLL